MPLHLKRIYDDPAPADGLRVLVDRLWPRGVSKDDAAIDLWLKDATPSTELRKQYHADPSQFDEFARRYRAELKANPDAIAPILEALNDGADVTLLYAAKNTEQNHAQVLQRYIESRAP